MRLTTRPRSGQSYPDFMNRWADALAEHKTVTSASALTASEYYGGLGVLPLEYQGSVRKASYAVFSYETPIAWFIPGEGWVMPFTKYSQTTTQHQHLVQVVIEHYLEKSITRL